jgi:hypothetical protein
MPSAYRKWARCDPHIHHIEAAAASNCCRIAYLPMGISYQQCYGRSRDQVDHDHGPPACLNGYIYLLYTAVDKETGEEVERIEALLCRRCAESR